MTKDQLVESMSEMSGDSLVVFYQEHPDGSVSEIPITHASEGHGILGMGDDDETFLVILEHKPGELNE